MLCYQRRRGVTLRNQEREKDTQGGAKMRGGTLPPRVGHVSACAMMSTHYIPAHLSAFPRYADAAVTRFSLFHNYSIGFYNTIIFKNASSNIP